MKSSLKRNIKRVLLCGALLWSTGSGIQAQVITPEAEQRAREIVARMTLEEKIRYIGGYHDFSIHAIPRLGLPEVKMADGPQGIRNDTQSTMYPSGILSAATWNRDLVRKLGEGLGQDAKARGVGILLGPGVNIYRSPLCGRNFEYFGEDPYLTSEVARCYIEGVQSQGVMATVKHFAANNQEWDRNHVSSDVDERTLQEIYFPAFRKAVRQANVGAVMNSYNLVNAVHATENRWMNIDVLRGQWGFKGILMSDWVSVYSAVAAANGGLDLEMPSALYMTEEQLRPAIEAGLVSEATIDLKVQHILQTLIAFGMLDRPMQDTSIPLDNPTSHEIALSLAREGLVLLKNEAGTLPLKGRTAVVGPNADRIPTGGGSGFVDPYSTFSVWQGMQELCGRKALLVDEAQLLQAEREGFFTDASLTKPGFNVEYFGNRDLSGKPIAGETVPEVRFDWAGAPAAGVPEDGFSVRCTSRFRPSKSGVYRLFVEGDDGYRLLLDGKELLADWSDHAPSTRGVAMELEAGKCYEIRLEHYDNTNAARLYFSMDYLDMNAVPWNKVDNLVVCVGFDSQTETEGSDRTFALPGWQNELIRQLASHGKKVTVVLNAGGGVDFAPWIEQVQAVLMAWYPGQEGGRAVAETLTGKIAPSGKLPISIEARWEDNPTSGSYYDRRNVQHKRVQYSEGIFVGYRGYDRSGIRPLFPFGFGLSYTTFAYSNLKVEKSGKNRVEVSFDIKNTGRMDGAEVAQVYVRDVESSVPRPLKELKGYEKVFLKRGETRRVSIVLDEEAFAYYDVERQCFRVEPGTFEILAGGSSAELPLKEKIELNFEL